MKLFYIFGTAAAGALGYMMEPSLRFMMTGVQPSPVEMAANGKVILSQADGSPNVELESLTADQLPKKIKINTAAKVSDPASGLTMSIEAGNQVKLVKIEGGHAVISPGEGPFLGKIPVMDTDLLQQLAKNPPTARRAAAPVIPENPEPVAPPVAAVPEPAVPEPAVPAGESVEPTPTPEPQPIPEPASIPEPPAVSEAPDMAEPVSPDGEVATNDVVKAMQESIKAGQIKEFTFEQVTEWKAGDDETVDGEAYKTGHASYSAETIFGTKVIQAKALVKDSKVARWIWPKSGMEIK